MRRRDLLVLVALAGCAPRDHDAQDVDAGPTDAAIDATLEVARIPLTTTGTTPAGSLDDIRYLGVEYLDGFCPSGIFVTLYRTNLRYEQPAVSVSVLIPAQDTYPPEPPTGVLAAHAWVGEDWQGGTQAASFEIVHVDLPPTDPLRLAGRLTANTAGWLLDFSFDVQTSQFTCI